MRDCSDLFNVLFIFTNNYIDYHIKLKYRMRSDLIWQIPYLEFLGTWINESDEI